MAAMKANLFTLGCAVGGACLGAAIGGSYGAVILGLIGLIIGTKERTETP
jgi:uncharacterized membrane protein